MDKRDLLDDGENRTVRAFLQLYDGGKSVTTQRMRGHLAASGFEDCWPDWTIQDGHLTAGGAQAWIRHLFALEAAAQDNEHSKCLPDGLRYGFPPLEMSGHQVLHLAAMARDADSLDAVWLLKEFAAGVDSDGDKVSAGLAVKTDGQPGWAMLSVESAQDGEQEKGIAELEAAGTSHDDGHFTWNKEPVPHKSNYAGWRADFYTADQLSTARADGKSEGLVCRYTDDPEPVAVVKVEGKQR